MYAVTLYDTYNRRVMAALAAAVALSVFAYGAFLLGAVAHATHRTQAEAQLSRVSAQISALESQYLAQTQALSPEAAAALGFVPPTDVATVFVSTQTLTLRE